MNKIKCNTINYRKGFIEISEEIHEGCINFEIWNIDPDIDISSANSTFDNLPDKAFTGNTEIELSIENTKQLLKALEQALKNVENSV